jgi:hypothetical protein
MFDGDPSRTNYQSRWIIVILLLSKILY